ncbi:hypothetical protein [Pseudomonas syringae]|uniref:SMI1/KNR4 family protein n=1 Tax=Pseudomonas syringae TaxID=317 RepID=A0A085VN79_PSESX|nr:hypothetical protein [Pseudomonas syringae]KFE56892.1 hypothetical protein IV01_06830 [Pseudomonas syringae]
MREKMDAATQAAVSFLKGLSTGPHIEWPHDFRVVEPSDEQLAEEFGYCFGGQRWSTSGDTFVQFGRDASGSMFLLWYYPGLNAKPPVVYVGSEGESMLLATDIEDFIRQLGLGESFCCGAFGCSDEFNERVWSELRRIIQDEFEFSDENLQQLIDKASQSHPDFTMWFESVVEYK